MAAVLTVNSTDRRFRFWHRRVHRDLALRLELSFHVSDQSSILLRTQPLLLVEQVILKAHDWIAFPPVLHHFRRHVVSRVMDGMPLHAHHLGLDQRRSFAAVGAFGGFVGGVINLTGIGAVNDHARNAVSDGAFG